MNICNVVTCLSSQHIVLCLHSNRVNLVHKICARWNWKWKLWRIKICMYNFFYIFKVVGWLILVPIYSHYRPAITHTYEFSTLDDITYSIYLYIQIIISQQMSRQRFLNKIQIQNYSHVVIVSLNIRNTLMVIGWNLNYSNILSWLPAFRAAMGVGLRIYFLLFW